MAEEIIGVKVQVDASDVGKSVGSLKQQLREAQGEVNALSEKFGATSKEAINAAKKAAQLKDAIGDAKALTDAFNPDAKFKSLTASLSGVAGGFAALQGAVGLFGNKAEAVEKTLLKVQSAMALSQGLQAVGESIDSFKQLGAVVKTGVSNAFGTLRGAIISTGIGALVVGLGLLIANFETVKKVVLNFIPGLGKLTDFIGNLVTKFTDFVGITSEADRVLEKLSKTNAKANENIEARVKLLTAQGGKEKEIYTLQKEANANETNALRERLKLTGTLTEEEAKRFRELKVESSVYDASEKKRLADNSKAASEASKKLAEEQKAIKEKAEADRKARQEQEYNDFVKFANDIGDSTNAEVELQDFLISETKRKEQELFEWRVNLQGQKNQESEDEFKFLQELNKKTVEDAQDTLDARLNAQIQFANAIGGVLSGLSGLFAQGTAASKIAAIAEIGLGTATGFINGLDIAQKGAKATGPAAPFAFPIFYASQIAAVLGAASKAKQVLSQVKGGAGGVSLPNAGGMGAAPVGVQIPTMSTVTQLNQSSINQMGSATGRAYVVESDITNSQEKITRINRAARLG